MLCSDLRDLRIETYTFYLQSVGFWAKLAVSMTLSSIIRQKPTCVIHFDRTSTMTSDQDEHREFFPLINFLPIKNHFSTGDKHGRFKVRAPLYIIVMTCNNPFKRLLVLKSVIGYNTEFI